MTKIIIGIATLAFFYFGYKDDFKRNKKETLFIASVVFVMMATFLALFQTNVYLAILLSFAIGSVGLLLKGILKF